MTTRDAAFANLGRIVAASVERQRGGSWQPTELTRRPADPPQTAPLDASIRHRRLPVKTQDRYTVIRRQQARCAYCATFSLELHIDHIKPVAAGGTSDLENLQGLCQPCNQRKGSTWPYDPR